MQTVKFGTITIELDTQRFGSAKIMVATLVVLGFVFILGQQLLSIVEGAEGGTIKAFIAFVFVVIGLLVFVEE